MKKVAVLGSLDTKYLEMKYLINHLNASGLGVFVIDMSLMSHNIPIVPDITNIEVLNLGLKDENNYSSESLHLMSKLECVNKMTEAIGRLLPKLYEQRKIDAAISVGGLQNTIMASKGLQGLPFGVPKVMISSMAAGSQTFERFIGRTDTIIFPSVADIVGINPITEKVFLNAVAAVVGMLSCAGKPFTVSEIKRPIVGITGVGVTYKSSTRAADILRKNGFDTCFFHGTTGGGPAMEDLVESRVISGVMDLCVHDVLVDALGYYILHNSEHPRLVRLASSGIPAVISLAGMDDIHMPSSALETLPNYKTRQIFWHSTTVLHVKVNKEEAKKGALLLADRLNKFLGPVSVLIPHNGFRANTAVGEEICDFEIDNIIIDTLKANLKSSINILDMNYNGNDILFGEAAAKEFVRLYNKK
jgi:uncharacterized protein (UPF0261 family)